MSDIITVSEMLAEMSNGSNFSIEYYTFDRKRKTGGELKSFDEAELLIPKKNATDGRAPTEFEKIKLAQKKGKKPNHKLYYTRNIRILQDGEKTTVIKKIHPLLVVKFNNRIVTL